MNLAVIGCNFQTAPVDIREKLAFNTEQQEQALRQLQSRYGCEAILLSTCNRVEMTLNRGSVETTSEREVIAQFLAEFHGLGVPQIQPLLYEHHNEQAVRHLCRVAASLDSLIVGEGQIAGQVKSAFEFAQKLGTTGPLLNTLFPHVLRTAKRVRTETGISHGHVSVSSVAVDYVRQVFDYFTDKTVLVIGAGKMARLTLKHLQALKPGRILVTNRNPAKAEEVAGLCGGEACRWEDLDQSLAAADIALSTTGAPEPIMPAKRFRDKVLPLRGSGTLVVLDIAVPRDFDPAIHDGDRVCLFNIDDLTRIREQTIAARHKHIAPAEQLIEQEVKRFLHDWDRRKSGPAIAQLRSEVDKVRETIVGPLLGKLNGKLSPEDKEYIAGAFRLFQNKVLHTPIAALQEASKEGESRKLIEAMRKLFGLSE
jgi:glutamyl-tRNA reductase